MMTYPTQPLCIISMFSPHVAQRLIDEGRVLRGEIGRPAQTLRARLALCPAAPGAMEREKTAMF